MSIVYDPRVAMRFAMFDAFSEMNSLTKQDLSRSSGQRQARISLRRIELSLDQLVEQTQKLREFIQEAESKEFDD
jgi:hypothetical protein